MRFHSLLAWRVSSEKSAVRLIGVPLWVIWHFSCACFNTFPSCSAEGAWFTTWHGKDHFWSRLFVTLLPFPYLVPSLFLQIEKVLIYDFIGYILWSCFYFHMFRNSSHPYVWPLMVSLNSWLVFFSWNKMSSNSSSSLLLLLRLSIVFLICSIAFFKCFKWFCFKACFCCVMYFF